MSLHETTPDGGMRTGPGNGAPPGDAEQEATPADLRMAEFLGDKDRTRGARERLREEDSDEAEDLIGRLNAMDFIDQVIGDDYEMPARIGEFEITGVLGRGGMGTVYQAYQASLDREVALKVLAPRFSSDVTMRTRFRKEAKATAAMHHQHIVPIYDYGEASGHLFFAMERVHGVSLDKHVSAARRNEKVAMEPLDAARRFAGVADALALAHKRKILHRDVKPGNILVHADGTLALADFGLSKFLGEQVSAHLTSVGGFLGTLHYSPPEQARGEALTPASDLYSLGVAMFECMTGHLPLNGDSTEAMLQALLHEEPTRLRQHLPKAPRDLEAVLEKLLNKKPAERYQDGEALALDLIRVAEGEPVRIRRQSRLNRLYRRARRNPVVPLSVVAVLVVTVITVLFARSLSDNKQLKARQVLNAAEAELRREPGLARGPSGIFNAITGARGVDSVQESSFLAELAAAAAQLPDDELPTIERFRAAYRGGVLRTNASVVQQLLAGNGKKVLKSLFSLIDEVQSKGTFDTAVRLDLYNLYLARAMVYLSASIGRLDLAASDLKLASFIRSGALLPRMLLHVLDAVSRDDGEYILTVLEPYVSDTAGDLRRSTAEFVLALANLCAPADAHLMRFELSYSTRKVLTQAALRWLGVSEPIENAGYTGLEAELARHAATVLTRSGNAQVVTAAHRAARAILEQMVGPGSRLQSWRYTFALLDDPEARTDELDTRHRLEGAIHYVRTVQETMPVEQTEALLRDQEQSLAGLIREMPSDPAAVELRARIGALSAAPGPALDAALQAVSEWIRLDESNPDAQLCAFCARVRGLPGRAVQNASAQQSAPDPVPVPEPGVLAGQVATAAAEALFCAYDQRAMRQRLVARLQAELERATGTTAGDVLRGVLKELDGAAGAGEGGR